MPSAWTTWATTSAHPCRATCRPCSAHGTLDGRTPIANAEAARRGFPHSHLVVVEGATHETPVLLLDLQTEFLQGKDPGVERLVRPFAFNPLRAA